MTAVATIGDKAPHPTVVKTPAPKAVMPLRLLFHFQFQSLNAKNAAVVAAPAPMETTVNLLSVCPPQPASAGKTVNPNARIAELRPKNLRIIPYSPNIKILHELARIRKPR